MNRKHDKRYYLSIIEKLKDANKDIKISSDFIIGYPGETEKDFEDTINLIERVSFINSYSFIFSPRPGTPAAIKKLNNSMVNKKRLTKLQKILENIQLKNNRNSLGKYYKVLVENKLDKQTKFFGRTNHMIPVIFEANNCKPGDFVEVKINSFNRNNLFGFFNKNKAA